MNGHLLRILAGMLLLVSPAAAAAPLPNIVVILADDLGSGDLGVYNPQSKIKTPALDQFAQQGLRLTDANTPSGVCTPTRYGLLTGRYCWRSKLKKGVLQGYSPALIEPDRLTIAGLLQQKGYSTAAIGKWHLGLGSEAKTDYERPLVPGPLQVGFESFYGIPASLDMIPYVYVEDEKVVTLPTANIADSKSQREGGAGFFRGGPLAPDFKHIDVLQTLTDRATLFLTHQAEQKDAKPFFLYLPLTSPHTPWLPKPEFAGKSGAGPYGDFVMQTDAAIGNVLTTLEKLKLHENTLVIITSDNGAHWLPSDIEKYSHRANWHYRGQKSDIHEGGHRVPFLVRWPGHVPAGMVTHQTVCLTDVFATCAEIVGVPLPENAAEDSFSLLPILLQPNLEKPVRQHLISHSGDGLFSVREGEWKFIPALGSGGFSAPKHEQPKPDGPTGQLYDLATDLGEQHNLFLQHPDKVAHLQQLLQQFQASGRSR